jgi:predicted house-cleaning noncanonical NTP pyrophosphatase (MazG superfamily)
MEYNKLVRDKIPQIIKDKGVTATIHIASKKEYEEKLREKLLEETKEYLEEPCAEELADILEVVYALASLLGLESSELEEIRRDKELKRGGFKERIILERTDN